MFFLFFSLHFGAIGFLAPTKKKQKKGDIAGVAFFDAKTKNKKAMAAVVLPSLLQQNKTKRRGRQQVVTFFAMLHQKIKLKEGKKAYLEARKWKLGLWRSGSGAPALALAMAIGGRRGEVGKK